MTNKIAPYKNKELMTILNKWWDERGESFRDSKVEMMRLFSSYQAFIQYDYKLWLTPEQFAKCLVAAKIAEVGDGLWRKLEGWEPKAYEIARARAKSL